MSPPYGTLAREQIVASYFVVPPIGILVAFGLEMAIQLQEARLKIRDAGGDLLVIGWPDGTTVIFEQRVCSNAPDLDFLTSLYRTNAAKRRAEERTPL